MSIRASEQMRDVYRYGISCVLHFCLRPFYKSGLSMEFDVFISVIECFSCCSRPVDFPFSALTLLVGQQDGHPACKSSVLVCWR